MCAFSADASARTAQHVLAVGEWRHGRHHPGAHHSAERQAALLSCREDHFFGKWGT